MGTALENARLFDETQRLLKITEERNAELAIINSVQAALAAELNIQGIYDAVGDKIREIFHKGDVGIRIYDPKTNLVHYPYQYENGERITIPSEPLPERGFGAHVIHNRAVVVINENILEEAQKIGSFIIPGTEIPKSQIMVPLVTGDQSRGLIEIVDMHNEHAFSESDVRLLTTLANSMSVALENARLFDETQRLLKETEQRAQELAIINSVQQGLASKLDMQAIYELIGEKISKMFNAQSFLISSFDHEKRARDRTERRVRSPSCRANDRRPPSPVTMIVSDDNWCVSRARIRNSRGVRRIGDRFGMTRYTSSAADDSSFARTVPRSSSRSRKMTS